MSTRRSAGRRRRRRRRPRARRRARRRRRLGPRRDRRRRHRRHRRRIGGRRSGGAPPAPPPPPPPPDPLAALPSLDFAPALDPAHPEVRYQLAVAQLTSGAPDRALALLASRAGADADACAGCGALAAGARYDDAWRAQWATAAFRAIADQARPGDWPTSGDEIVARCPRGAKPRGASHVMDRGRARVWCERRGKKHGSYDEYEEGYDLGEGVRWVHGAYADGVQVGMWSQGGSYDDVLEGGYVAGKPHGLWTTATKYATTYEVYDHGVLDGAAITVAADDGVVVKEEAYRAGKLDGPALERQEEAPHALVATGAYAGGAPDGTWIRYDDLGRRRSEEHWDHGVRHGTFRYWDAAGAVLATAELDHDSGDWIAYDDRGLAARGTLDHGQKVGAWGEQTGDGWEEGTYAAGQRTGTWTRRVAPGGARLAEGPYVRGVPHGAWTFWRDDGSPLARGGFAAGKLDGAWTVLDDHGEVAQALVFRKGALISVDGERATRALRRGFAQSGFATEPVVIEPVDDEPPY
ncbi:MAG: hypothetical protein H6708_19635 [Kofleriaceae bacterium]|nr:hypothetical protein [Kofleriaceae bacterium]